MKTYLCLVALFIAAGGPARAGVDIALVRIDETRSEIIHDDNVSRGMPGLKLLLSVSGPEAEAATQYGDLTIDEVVDDTGSSLIPASDALNDPKKFKDFDNAFFRKSTFGDRPPAAPEIELALALPKRSATKITRLRGSVSLVVLGQLTPVELGNLKSPGEKKLNIPASANVGVTATVASGDNVRSVSIEITGDENVIESIVVVDSDGKEISGGMSSFTFMNGPVHHTLSLRQPLNDSMKLVAKLALDRRITKVPFDLKDIPLP